MDVKDKYQTLITSGLSDYQSYLFSFLCQDLYDPRLLILIGQYSEFRDIFIVNMVSGLRSYWRNTRSVFPFLPTAVFPIGETQFDYTGSLEGEKVLSDDLPYYLQMD